jgi:hypothetical protein
MLRGMSDVERCAGGVRGCVKGVKGVFEEREKYVRDVGGGERYAEE